MERKQKIWLLIWVKIIIFSNRELKQVNRYIVAAFKTIKQLIWEECDQTQTIMGCCSRWLYPREREIRQIRAVRGYSSGKHGAISPARGYPQCPARKWCFLGYVTNPLLTKLVSSRWADMRLLLICVLWASSASWFINTQNRTWSIFNRHGLGLSITHIYFFLKHLRGPES